MKISVSKFEGKDSLMYLLTLSIDVIRASTLVFTSIHSATLFNSFAKITFSSIA